MREGQWIGYELVTHQILSTDRGACLRLVVIVGSASTAIAEKKVVHTLQIQSPITIVHILTCRGYRDNWLILTKL